MPPLEASCLVKACCVLHNRCLDWGLHRIRPGMNKDPQYENNIQALACQRFRVANHRKFDEDDNNDEEDNDPTQRWTASTGGKCTTTKTTGALGLKYLVHGVVAGGEEQE